MTQRKKPEDHGAVGRPTKYRRKFCDQVIAHMAGGLSFESFAGEIGVSKDTIYQWKEKYPEFSYAVKRAIERCRLWWESLGLQGVQGFGPEMVKKRKIDAEGNEEIEYGAAQFNPTTWIFNMCNRFGEEWRQRNEVTGKDGAPLIPPPMDWKTLEIDPHVKQFMAERGKPRQPKPPSAGVMAHAAKGSAMQKRGAPRPQW